MPGVDSSHSSRSLKGLQHTRSSVSCQLGTVTCHNKWLKAVYISSCEAQWVLLSWQARQAGAFVRGRCLKEMRNSTRLSVSWNTSVMSVESPKYRWRSAAHFGQKRSKCSAVSSPVPQRDVIWPRYEAVEKPTAELLLNLPIPAG